MHHRLALTIATLESLRHEQQIRYTKTGSDRLGAVLHFRPSHSLQPSDSMLQIISSFDQQSVLSSAFSWLLVATSIGSSSRRLRLLDVQGTSRHDLSAMKISSMVSSLDLKMF